MGKNKETKDTLKKKTTSETPLQNETLNDFSQKGSHDSKQKK